MKKITFLSVFACLAIASFAQTSPQDYTSDGTFTVPTGVNTITVEVVGAGGNNGGFPGGSGGAGNGSGSPGTDGAKGFVRILWGLATGMESVTLTQVTTYPNPFTSTINVKNNRGNETYTLTNTVGEVIWNGKNINDQSFSQLQKGVYFLSITTYNNSYVQKLIKE